MNVTPANGMKVFYEAARLALNMAFFNNFTKKSIAPL